MRQGDPVEAKVQFEGRLVVASFCAFANHRAARLSLDLVFGEAAPQGVVCHVRGPLALIDAFEMACSLGPIDCLVIEVRRADMLRENGDV